MVILWGATFSAEDLIELTFALGRTARGFFGRPIATTTTAVIMVVDLVFTFSTQDKLVVVVAFVRIVLGILAALII